MLRLLQTLGFVGKATKPGPGRAAAGRAIHHGPIVAPTGWLTGRPARYNGSHAPLDRSGSAAIAGVRDNVNLEALDLNRRIGGLRAGGGAPQSTAWAPGIPFFAAAMFGALGPLVAPSEPLTSNAIIQ